MNATATPTATDTTTPLPPTLTLAAARSRFGGGTRDALRAAVQAGYRLDKLTDPTEVAREGLSVDDAVVVAAEDEGLIVLALTDAQLR